MTSSCIVHIPIFAIAAQADHFELSRLLAAALVNEQFESLLLADPEAALAYGYLGETLDLTGNSQDFV
jgi:hypothetical protein